MVFRCRPKPNLSAAKKAQISKESIDQKPAIPATASTSQVKNESSLIVQKSSDSTNEPPPNLPIVEKVSNAEPPKTTSEPPQITSEPPQITSEPPKITPEPLKTTPFTPNKPIVDAVVSETIPIGPSPATYAVPRPPANITADNSLASTDDSESPLFIPQKSEVSLIPNDSSESTSIPLSLPERTIKPKNRPFEPTIDLDEADNEDSSDDSVNEKVSLASPRKRKIEDVLLKPKAKKQRTQPPRSVGSVICGPPDRSKVKMRDLIYCHNVTQPPPQYRQEREIKQKGRRGCLWMYHHGMPEVADVKPGQPAAASDESSKDCKSSLSNSTSSPADTKPEKASEEPEKAEKKPDVKPDMKPVQTQFVMDADGNIVLNEDSLVIRREYTDADYIDIKQDSFMGSATYSSYRTKRPRAKKWSIEENIRLYKALSTIGTDFSCMVRLFKNRTREEIKRKFKREEKERPQLIDHVLSNRKSFDLSLLDNPDDDVMPVIDNDSDSSSDSNEDVLQKAVLNLDGKEKPHRRPKHFKRIDLDPMPANPLWYNAKSAYKPDTPPVRRPKPDPGRSCGVVEEAEAALRQSRGPSLDRASFSPRPPASPCCSTASGGVEDVLSRLIGQKMRHINQRPTTPITPVLPPTSPTRTVALPEPAVKNSSLSLTDFCKMEAQVDS